MSKDILLTFDIEEFDLPEEYNIPINKEEQLNVTTQGLKSLLILLDKYNIQATFFTTAYYAIKNPDLIKLISNKHEIASHMYYHSNYETNHIIESKRKLEEITGKTIYGFRMPLLKKTDIKLIKDAGYLYDSSINPTYIPSRYNNMFTPRKLYNDSNNDLFVLPFSVSPLFRIPLFWLSFKNFNFLLYIFLCKQTIKKDNYLHLYFHPWEFADLSSFNIPKYIKRYSGANFIKRFDNLLNKLSKEGDFISIKSFLEKQNIEEIFNDNK